MSTFTPQEISTICLFFGVSITTPGNPIGPDHYFLEPHQVCHPVGDYLDVLPNGYVVQFAESENHPHPYYFSRDFGGLYNALQHLTSEIA